MNKFASISSILSPHLYADKYRTYINIHICVYVYCLSCSHILHCCSLWYQVFFIAQCLGETNTHQFSIVPVLYLAHISYAKVFVFVCLFRFFHSKCVRQKKRKRKQLSCEYVYTYLPFLLSYV